MNLQRLLPWGSRPAACLPRVVAEALADLAATVCFAVWRRGRRVVAENLGGAIGHATAGTVCGVFRTYARYYLSILRLAHAPVTRAVGRYRWVGDDQLDASHRRGRGIVVLSAHLGNWDLVGMALAARGAEVCVVVEPLEPPGVFEFYRRVRTRHGVGVTPLGRLGRAPAEVLERNGVLGLVVDRAFGARREDVLLGALHLGVPTGGIRRALRSGAAIHGVFAERQANGWVIRCGPDWGAEAQPLATEAAQVRYVSERFAAALQDVVSRCPDQWCAFAPLPRFGPVPLPAGRAA